MIEKISSKKIIGSIVIFAILLFIYVQIASRILFTSIDFDEGYNLQISHHLSNNPFNYATYTGKFDPNITTGPALLIPSAFFINTSNPLIPRVIMLIFAIIFLTVCQVYMYTGHLQRIIFLASIALTPLFYFFSSHVLGELPGFVLFLISLITLSKRKYFLSGLFIALSILTKQVYTFGIISVVLQFMLIHIFSKRQRATVFRNLALMISGYLVVILLWYSYILVSNGLSYFAFKNTLLDYRKTTHTLSSAKLSLIDKRLDMFKYVFGINGLIFTVSIIYSCWLIIKKLRHNHIAVSLAFFSLIYTIYFLFLGSTNWYRHFFPVVLALVICLPLCSDILLTEVNRKKLAIFAIITILLLGNSIYYFSFQAKNDTEKKLIDQNLVFQNEKLLPRIQSDQLLISQMQTAKYIKNNIKHTEIISGISWWNAPEIEYLSNRKIERDPFKKNTDYLITQYYGNLLAPNDYEYLDMLKIKKEIHNSEGYIIYKIN